MGPIILGLAMVNVIIIVTFGLYVVYNWRNLGNPKDD